MTRSCAACGWRDSVDVTDWDGRMIPICGVCLEPPDVPPEWSYEPTSEAQVSCIAYSKPTRAAIAAYISDVGEATSADVVRRFGAAPKTRWYSTITMFLFRMKRDGELVARKAGGPGGHEGSFVYSEGTAVKRRYRPQRTRAEVVDLARRGMSAKEIAASLGMNTTTVMVALSSARRDGDLERRTSKRGAA